MPTTHSKCATDEWMRAVAAVGALQVDAGPQLIGSSFCIDSERRILVMAAHVWRAIQELEGALDPFGHGVAIGFKPLEPARAEHGEIDWVGRAFHCESPGVLDAPSWAAPKGLDLVVLRLTQEIDGSQLAPGREMPAALDAPDNAQRHTLAALQLGDASTLKLGDQLVVLGFGCPNRAAGIGLARPVPISFRLPKETHSGLWIETAATVYRGHSGGPVLTFDGKIVGWVSRSQPDDKGTMVLDEYRPVNPPSKYTEPMQCIWGAVAAALGCPDQWQQPDDLRKMLKSDGTIEAGTFGLHKPDGVMALRQAHRAYTPAGSRHKQGTEAQSNSVADSFFSHFEETGSTAPSETEMPSQQQILATVRQMQAQLQAQEAQLDAQEAQLKRQAIQLEVKDAIAGLPNTGRPAEAATTVQKAYRMHAAVRNLLNARRAAVCMQAAARRRSARLEKERRIVARAKKRAAVAVWVQAAARRRSARLEKQRRIVARARVRIQADGRRALKRIHFVRLRKAAVRVQSRVRGFSQRFVRATRPTKTALLRDVQNGHESVMAVVTLLLDKGESVDKVMTWAAENGHAAVVKVLLDKGAAVDKVMTCAAEKGHAAVVKLLLDMGAAVDAANEDGWTALELAAEKGHAAVVKVLLDKGAAVDKVMTCAAEKGHAAVVKLLLDMGAAVDAANEDGWTALELAAEKGHVAVVKVLLDKKGAAVDKVMTWAARNGHAVVVKVLLDKGAAVDATYEDGYTALIFAAENGHEAVVKLLLDKGAAVDVEQEDGWTALMFAAHNGHAAVATLLLDQGAAVDATTKKGSTAMMWAARDGHAVVVKVLLDKGAAIDAEDEDGYTALELAVEKGHAAVVKLLLDKGAAVDADLTHAALELAVEKGHAAVVKLLLDKGAAVDAVNEDGYTALELAAEKGHEAVVKLLLDKGAAVDADLTHAALELAAENGHEVVVKLLLDKGAAVGALTFAAQKGDEAMVKLLLGKGAAVDATNEDGYTALELAAEKGHVAVVKLLLDKGAAVDATYDSGLVFAARHGHAAVAKLLLDKGAAVDAFG